ncbi:UDP-4-amino-4,6-dideoxy-N-acetyl-beta-L-altrosamine transaminase [Dongia soli]|uniref:UDP-4-amino-4, 6-dideoxy-N-acetyl-beta-L-altrosamine transaminase n=1 Tax=Dongia soli TaxID=600628 RepID=A0ABU5ECN8_9PROT|nr:UDP-4-amino-4,6-dideoxy-N-acetyl-beta-L-altrosamine transaminase [Dongia soli]MDY0883188.1 UDP-4-amino-4,6-dideoxy-N-acetyl-beta-L-altrosamine transaminase [Dongia soli]
MSTASPFLPYGKQCIDDEDVAAVAAALRGDYLTTGPTVGQFERAFADYVGARFAVASNSGTAALHLACMALGLGPGDHVVVPSVTFLATANAARFCGAEVIFADVDPHSGRMTAATLEEALARQPGFRPRAVLPVHLNGHCVDVAAIQALADRSGMAVIEDACHALGGLHAAGNDTRASVGACALSQLSCFSLHPVKTMTTGEGGVTTTNDEQLYRRMQLFRNHGMTRDAGEFTAAEQAFDTAGAALPWYYEMQELGPNYRITDIACALGLSQLRKLPSFVDRRRKLAAYYDRALADLAPRLTLIPRQPDDDPALHLYVVLVDFAAIGCSRSEAMAILKARGIGTQVHYLPVHRQPYYVRRYGTESLPGADAYYERALSIPLYPDMTEADAARVVTALHDLVS